MLKIWFYLHDFCCSSVVKLQGGISHHGQLCLTDPRVQLNHRGCCSRRPACSLCCSSRLAETSTSDFLDKTTNPLDKYFSKTGQIGEIISDNNQLRESNIIWLSGRSSSIVNRRSKELLEIIFDWSVKIVFQILYNWGKTRWPGLRI